MSRSHRFSPLHLARCDQRCYVLTVLHIAAFPTDAAKANAIPQVGCFAKPRWNNDYSDPRFERAHDHPHRIDEQHSSC